MTMLEYCKMILEKVSFDKSLFRAEYLKAITKLLREEIQDLKNWCIEKFGQTYCEEAAPGFFLPGA